MANNLVGFILAAGYSKRLKELTKDKPKSFLEINNKRIINYHLEELSKIGIKKVYIVVGFLKHKFKEAIGNNYKGMEIHYIDNDEYETTGHSYSVFLGREVFKKNDILLIFADVFCDPQIYKTLINSKSENIVLVDEGYQIITKDELVVQGLDGIISGMGYNRFDEKNVQGEFVGMNRFSGELMTKWCDYMGNFFKKENKSLNYEVLLDKFIQDSGVKINYQTLNGKKWININYKEDYETAQKMAQEFAI